MKPKTAKELMTENLLVKHYAGSHAYGTSTPTSDVDFRGIFVADPINVRTPFYRIDETTDTSEEDTKFYELSNFMKLALDCNPNVIETLWVDEKDIVHQTEGYKLLREAREKLLSRKVVFTFSGYAMSQLKRIRGHNKWINNPQEFTPPRQIDFVSLVHNFTKAKIFKVDMADYRVNYRLVPFSGDVYGLYEAHGYMSYSDDFTLNTAWEGDSHQLGEPLFVVKFNKQVYLEAKEKWAQYWEWKKNRNVKRSELEEKFGYDTKHAMHLVRLLRMCSEVLKDGVVNVRRPDAEELLQIRNGAWSYEDLVTYAEGLDKYNQEVLYPKSNLPAKPNLHLAAELIMDVQDLTWLHPK